MVAAASFSGFVGKWGLGDGKRRSGFELMINARADRPFVYRQLAPMIANLADRVTPDRVKDGVIEAIGPGRTFARVTLLDDPQYRFRYIVVYYLSFISLFASLFVLRQIAIDAGASRMAAAIAPTALALAFPYLQSNGGFFYDNIELLFLSISFMLAARGKGLLLVALSLAATLNKETFFFFIPALYPLLRYKGSATSASVWILLSVCGAAIINIVLKFAFLDAPGTMAEFHLLENLASYRLPWFYRQLEITYGIVGPAGLFVGTLVAISIVVLRGWPTCPVHIRRHLAVAAAINFPLFLVFGATGELRNLSFLLVGFAVLIALAIDRDLRQVADRSVLP